MTDDYDHDKHPPLPGHKEHSCTDKPFLILLLLALAGIGYIEAYSMENGDFERLTHGYDLEERLCGINDTVWDKPYVYWCKNAVGQLAVKYPICVADCPKDNTGVTECHDPDTGRTTLIPTYPTKRRVNFCFPKDVSLWRMFLDRYLWDGASEFVVTIYSSLTGGRWLIATAGVGAIVVGYTYLFLLYTCAGPLARLSLFSLIMVPLCVGGFFIHRAVTSEPSEEHTRKGDAFFGLCGIGVGLLFLVVTCCAIRGLETAVGCVEASCECLFSEPSLLIEPFLSIVMRVLTTGLMVASCLHLLSCAGVNKGGDAGILKTLDLTPEQWVYLIFLGFMTIWTFELGLAISQYALAYATQMWYFTPYEGERKKGVPFCAIARAYCNVFTFHLGTVTLGSLLIATLRFLRIIGDILAKSAEAEGNCVGKFLAKSCVCLLDCFRKFFEFLNKAAYMDVAITSDNFCPAARRAVGVLAELGNVVAILEFAQVLFAAIGFGIICGVPSGLAMLLCLRLDRYTNPQSPNYVEEPRWVGVACVVVCGVIGVSFLLVLDTIGDTMLYCFSIDKKRQRTWHSSMLHAKRQSNSSDSETEEDDESFFEWLFGTAGEATRAIKDNLPSGFGTGPVRYAPPRLHELMQEHNQDSNE